MSQWEITVPPDLKGVLPFLPVVAGPLNLHHLVQVQEYVLSECHAALEA